MRIIDIPEFKDKTDVLTMPQTAALREVIQKMAERKVGSVVIVENSKVVGIFTERDLLLKVVAKDRSIAGLTVAEVMTTHPKTAKGEDTVADSLRRMSQGRFRHLPVVDENKNLIGIISQGDFVAYTWYDLFNRLTNTTKRSFLSNTQLWMLILGPLAYLFVLKYFVH